MMRPGYWWAVRKSDGVRLIVWCYATAQGAGRVACCRTQRELSWHDFSYLAPVEDPFTTPLPHDTEW